MLPNEKPLFEGCATALVTPMKHGALDSGAYDVLLHNQLEADIDALVICGTTGESPTLTDAEKKYLFTQAVKTVKSHGKATPVIAGTGSNNTARAIELSRMAEAAGCDGLLLVTPYYNKASQMGLISHFLAIAEAVSLPIILYHVPSRTGCTMTVDTCRTLAAHPRIKGLKDATGNINFTARVAAACGDTLPLYAGNDDIVTPLLSLGGKGVISVVSNLLPREMVDLCRLWFAGKTQSAVDIQKRLLPLCDALFSEVNPIPVKAAMSLCGMCTSEVRLPLAPADEALFQRLREMLTAYGLNSR